MNKPHLLFHLGTRRPISTNIGFGYWMNKVNKSSENSYFSKMRLWYENKDNGLYINVKSHDGEKHIH